MRLTDSERRLTLFLLIGIGCDQVLPDDLDDRTYEYIVGQLRKYKDGIMDKVLPWTEEGMHLLMMIITYLEIVKYAVMTYGHLDLPRDILLSVGAPFRFDYRSACAFKQHIAFAIKGMHALTFIESLIFRALARRTLQNTSHKT